MCITTANYHAVVMKGKKMRHSYEVFINKIIIILITINTKQGGERAI